VDVVPQKMGNQRSARDTQAGEEPRRSRLSGRRGSASVKRCSATVEMLIHARPLRRVFYFGRIATPPPHCSSHWSTGPTGCSELALARRLSHIWTMAKHATTARRSASSGQFVTTKDVHSVGRTSDGVVILKPATKPTHFTQSEIRGTVREVKGSAGRLSNSKKH
jgi:hypothetical protein